MNWRFFFGSQVALMEHAILSRLPPSRYYPVGRNWLYDLRRFSNQRQPSIIFDIGANVGQTAWGLVRYFPSAKIYCFEPDQRAYGKLVSDYSKYRNIKFLQLALGNVSEMAEMNICELSELNTMLSLSACNHKNFSSTKVVRVQRLDDFCSEHKILSIDVLKMDVQGWELQILAGASKMIAENKIRFVKAEVGFSSTDTDMTQFVDFHKAIEKLDFKLCGFYDSFRWGENKEFVGFADALYVKM